MDFITKTELDQKRLNEALFLAIKRIRELHTVREQTFSYKMGRRLINQNIRDILYIVTTEHSHKLKRSSRSIVRVKALCPVKYTDQIDKKF